MKYILIGLLFVSLTGCGSLSDLLENNKDDIEDTLSTIASGDIAFSINEIKDILGLDINSVISCDDFTKNISLNTYPIEPSGEIEFNKNVQSTIVYKESSNTDTCEYSYQTNLEELDDVKNAKWVTIEPVLTSGGSQLIQRYTTIIQKNKNNKLDTIKSDNTEINDLIITTITEFDSDILDKLQPSELDGFKSMIAENAREIKEFTNSLNTPSIPTETLYQRYKENETLTLQKIAEHESIKEDVSLIKDRCKNDQKLQGFVIAKELEHDKKYHYNNPDIAEKLFDKVFGPDFRSYMPIAYEIMMSAFVEGKKFALTEVARATLESMNCHESLQHLSIQNCPENKEDILSFIMDDIIDGEIQDIFNVYKNNTETYEQYNQADLTHDNGDVILSNEAVLVVFNENHKWKNIKNLEDNETIDILETWVILNINIAKKRISDEHFDMGKFFYELGVITREDPFVLEAFVEEEEIYVRIFDKTGEHDTVNVILNLDNNLTREITLGSPIKMGEYEKEFRGTVTNIDYISMATKIRILDQNNNISAEDKCAIYNEEKLMEKYFNNSQSDQDTSNSPNSDSNSIRMEIIENKYTIESDMVTPLTPIRIIDNNINIIDDNLHAQQRYEIFEYIHFTDPENIKDEWLNDFKIETDSNGTIIGGTRKIRQVNPESIKEGIYLEANKIMPDEYRTTYIIGRRYELSMPGLDKKFFTKHSYTDEFVVEEANNN